MELLMFRRLKFAADCLKSLVKSVPCILSKSKAPVPIAVPLASSVNTYSVALPLTRYGILWLILCAGLPIEINILVLEVS